MPPKQTPYFLFCNEARESAREEFAKQGVPNPTGAAVAKVLGERWKNLSEEEKTHYKNKAGEIAAELLRIEAENAENNDDNDEEGREEDEKSTHLPLARVKRIMRLDRSVRLIHLDTLKLVAKTTELFIEHLIEKSEGFCRAKKRKTVMYSDIEHTVAHDERLI
eukprot:CAMPEP_0118923724 /NCGR_PEP_ID=MMETSP1169-20130426/2145_1 /TAXON_ID=36882 /ORGANISM="Pyramimonas obovata, Strain CCMP722" /LENGTH=163 /DNA_ID=CAMNT_0006864751 /DNA_START=54 /DNA_END=542 /DNA_ORIENTATION=+